METPNNEAGRLTERIMAKLDAHIKRDEANPAAHYNRAYEAIYYELSRVHIEPTNKQIS